MDELTALHRRRFSVERTPDPQSPKEIHDRTFDVLRWRQIGDHADLDLGFAFEELLEEIPLVWMKRLGRPEELVNVRHGSTPFWWKILSLLTLAARRTHYARGVSGANSMMSCGGSSITTARTRMFGIRRASRATRYIRSVDCRTPSA